jgi:hypothetical protein
VSRRSRIVGFGSAVALVIAGIACAFVFSGGLAQNLAFVLVALGLVLGTALVFYEVGLTEDKDRAREELAARRLEEDARRREREDAGMREREDAGKREREDAGKREHPPERSTRIRLGRSRGRPRRLR